MTEPTAMGSAFNGGRTYDYKQQYPPDKPGEGLTGNARVWKVYLDEAGAYDADIMQGYRNMIDNLLIFASLFSAVVTTFVAQTSQTLQPDNVQILVYLLSETNQLLRANGNTTNLNAVQTAALAPGSPTHTSTDVWVNGLFFTSLALSLSTALLSVLAKQWIQAYMSIVPGGPKTRALIRQFRFQGLIKWKLGDIIESLPAILHSSVAIFLIGLVLYVSQLSSPICGVVAVITTLTFLFYWGSSLLPAVFLDCPFRFRFIFSHAQLALFISHMTSSTLQFLWCWLLSGCANIPHMEWPPTAPRSLKTLEFDAVFPSSIGTISQIDCNTLNWIVDHSSNPSVEEIVFETVSYLAINGTLADISILEHDLFRLAVTFALDKLADMASPSTTEDDLEKNVWARTIHTVHKHSHLVHCFTSLNDGWHGLAFLNGAVAQLRDVLNVVPGPPIGSLATMLNGPQPTRTEVLQKEVYDHMARTCLIAHHKGDHVLIKHLVSWGLLEIPQEHFLRWEPLVNSLAARGISDLSYTSDNGSTFNQSDYSGNTALHEAVLNDNLFDVLSLVKRQPSLLHVRTKPPESRTALDLALAFGHSHIVAYLLDNGAERCPNALHIAAGNEPCYMSADLIKVLLDRGWDRAARDMDGRTAIDMAKAKEYHEVAQYLECYQTVALRPHSIETETPGVSGIRNSEETWVALNVMG